MPSSETFMIKVTGLKEGLTATGGKVEGITMNWDDTASTNLITLSSAVLGEGIVSISGMGILGLANDVSSPSPIQAHWTVENGTAKYNSASTSAGYTLASDKKSVSYTAGSSSKVLATVTGLKNSATQNDLSLSGNVITLKNSALDGNNISVSGNYTLALASNVTQSKTTAAGFTVIGTTATYKSKKNSAGYTLASDKKSVSYKKASGGNTLITLSGLKSGTKASKLTLKNKTVTLASGIIGNKGASVKGGGYTFVMKGAGKLTNAGAAATFKGSSGKDSLIGGTGNDTL